MAEGDFIFSSSDLGCVCIRTGTQDTLEQPGQCQELLRACESQNYIKFTPGRSGEAREKPVPCGAV